jgi:hypothetical protein
MQAEAEIEAALSPLFESGRYAIKGHRSGARTRGVPVNHSGGELRSATFGGQGRLIIGGPE